MFQRLYTNWQTNTTLYNFTKPESDYIPISAGEYINKLQKSCVDNDTYTFVHNTKKTPF
jgi:hypothetical protein